MRNRLWPALQLGLLGVAVAVVAWRLRSDWAQVSSSPADFELHVGWLAASLLVTWLMYAGLIEGWRRLTAGWSGGFRWIRAARIWTLSSVAALIPGRVWGFAGMAMMSERVGVGAGAALAAAVVMQVLSIGTGVGVAAIALGPAIARYQPGAETGLVVLGTLAILSTVAMGNQRVLDLIWRIVRRPGPPPTVPSWGALLEAGLINTLAWIGYGVAFWALARGLLPDAPLSLRVSIGAFTVSYLAGYLAFFTPGGLGVRELLLVGLLSPSLGTASAVALSLASRLVTLVNQLGAAVPFLLSRESTSDGQ